MEKHPRGYEVKKITICQTEKNSENLFLSLQSQMFFLFSLLEEKVTLPISQQGEQILKMPFWVRGTESLRFYERLVG